MAPSGLSTSTVSFPSRPSLNDTSPDPNSPPVSAKSEFLITGAADNSMRLWEVSTGKCLYTWNFDTAVRRVAFSEDDKQIVQITEQRMGFQGAIRVFNLNKQEPTNRTLRIH